jgi:hypothetical protein
MYYERVVRLALLGRMLPNYLLSFAVAAGVIAFSSLAITFVGNPGHMAVQTQSSPPPSSAPMPRPFPILPQGFDVAVSGKIFLERAVSGQLDQQTLDSLRQLPEFDRCQDCFNQCDEDFPGGIGFARQDCKRECLRNCSETTRNILNH